MRWTDEVERGRWFRERLNDRWGSIHFIIPTGFEAYARVFHPADRDRLVAPETWREWVPGSIHLPEIERQKVSWATVADAFGTTMHPLAQFGLVLAVEPDRNGQLLDVHDWRYNAPQQGNLDAATVTSLARHLSQHTASPDSGIVAVWEGWGGMLMPVGSGESTLLDLPWRRHVLFEAGVSELADPDWPASAPWVEPVWAADSPSIIWPDDLAWVSATEVDFDSTLVAGSRALIDELVASTSVEALEIDSSADLTSAGDRVNPDGVSTPGDCA